MMIDDWCWCQADEHQLMLWPKAVKSEKRANQCYFFMAGTNFCAKTPVLETQYFVGSPGQPSGLLDCLVFLVFLHLLHFLVCVAWCFYEKRSPASIRLLSGQIRRPLISRQAKCAIQIIEGRCRTADIGRNMKICHNWVLRRDVKFVTVDPYFGCIFKVGFPKMTKNYTYGHFQACGGARER